MYKCCSAFLLGACSKRKKKPILVYRTGNKMLPSFHESVTGIKLGHR